MVVGGSSIFQCSLTYDRGPCGGRVRRARKVREQLGNLGIGASGMAWHCLASEEPVPGRPRLCGLPGGGLASFQLGPPTMTQLR